MTKLIGHRGVAGIALENSADSIKAALALPITGIELDVRRTKDNKLVILHDRHTGRVAEKRVVVNDATLAELRQLKLKNGQHLLTLDEVFDMVDGKSKMDLTLDIKDRGIAQSLARVLAEHPNVNVTISSWKYAELEAIHRALPDIPFLAQSHLSASEAVHAARHLRATGVSLNKWLMNPYIYRMAREFGLEVRAYTINSLWQFKLFQKLYPDVVIYTDHPMRLLQGTPTHANNA